MMKPSIGMRVGHGPQVKVCGLTVVEEAVACAELGVDALGLVFYPPSPRFVSDQTAASIVAGLPERIWTVGVFVNESFSAIMQRVEKCRIRAVQLHGAESPDLVAALMREGVLVIKSLFQNRRPNIAEFSSYGASAYLVEGGGGALPGGNALTWNWSSIRESLGEAGCILAGGLDPGNVAPVIEAVSPDAVDVSSGVESRPGRKDIVKVTEFMKAVRGAMPGCERERIFK